MDGNTIFVSAFDKRIIEVTPEGERVEDYRLPRNGRMDRVCKYPKDDPGLIELGTLNWGQITRFAKCLGRTLSHVN
jgi:hypothetical protein